MRRAQASMEFTIAIGFIIVIFLIIFGFALDKRIELNKTKTLVDKKDACFMVLNNVVSAYNIGDGTEILTDVGYNLSIAENAVYIDEYSCFSHIGLFSSSGESAFELIKGRVLIKNNNGAIEVSNA